MLIAPSSFLREFTPWGGHDGIVPFVLLHSWFDDRATKRQVRNMQKTLPLHVSVLGCYRFSCTPPRPTTDSAILVKSRYQWRQIPLLPSPTRFRKNLLAVAGHFVNEGAGSPRRLVPRTPYKQLQKHRRQIDAFLCQPIVYPTSVGFLRCSDDNSSRFELAQAVSQYVGGNAFARLLELLEGLEAANHQITNDQKRPAVPQRFKRNTDRTAGAPLELWFASQSSHRKNITCKKQAIFKETLRT